MHRCSRRWRFRFDTADGTVTFSGDTAPSDNLVKLAAGSDILVHEIIDRAWAEALFPEPRTPAAEATLGHLLESHTTIEDIGSVAQRAGAAKTVLSHMVPLNNPESRWLQRSARLRRQAHRRQGPRWRSASAAAPPGEREPEIGFEPTTCCLQDSCSTS